MKHPVRFLLAAWLPVLAGCLPGHDPEPGKNPYAGLSCEATLPKMQTEINAYNGTGLRKAGVEADSGDTLPRKVLLIRGYPPISGSPPGTGNSSGSEEPRDRVLWIPPVGFETGMPSSTPLPMPPADSSAETAAPVPIPANISTVQIVTTEKYTCEVRIFDYSDRLVREFRQSFGYQGEMENLARVTPIGSVSYLVWDMKNADGNPVETGVYLWEIRLTLASNAVETGKTKAGVITDDRCAAGK